ncbi:hypothetical protein D3C85_1756480 [compost metagenome]
MEGIRCDFFQLRVQRNQMNTRNIALAKETNREALHNFIPSHKFLVRIRCLASIDLKLIQHFLVCQNTER